ncbi:polysaccharide biosynthesis protein [Nitritalea halalkaliphila LW7]|uniref:Polysaccharide biosynthesis protein n=1 Tax=Nitritalea halalkaliphila LW7 TaxID=1189621 RepID=I5CAK9_9BACT|nr:lipopolysaccharide biosynthesis protein [Nitritalea halalkaliphila]EIM78861.1 polysaccharide biosynthesis protein [Nitritalea halalkaliphila LW7]
MQNLKRQSLLTGLSSYAGVVIGYVNLLWLLPFIFSPEEFGTFRAVQDLGLLLVPFAQLGAANGLIRFFPTVRDRPLRLVMMSFGLSAFGFLLVLAAFQLFDTALTQAFSQNAAALLEQLTATKLLLFFALSVTLLEALSASYFKMAMPTFLRDVGIRLMTFGLGLSYYFGLIDFDQTCLGLAVIYALNSLFLVLYLLRQSSPTLPAAAQRDGTPPAILSLRNFLTYSLITMLGAAGGIIVSRVDSLMVSSLIGLEATAVYAIGFSMAVVIELPRRVLSQVHIPAISQHMQQEDRQAIAKLYTRMGVAPALLALLVFILIWVCLDGIYAYIPNAEVYQAGKWVVFWIGCAKLIDGLFSFNGEIIVYSKYYRFNLVATLLMSVAVIGFNLLLIPVHGVSGAAFASFLAMVGFNLLKAWFLYTKMRLHPFSIRQLYLLAISLLALTPHLFLKGLELAPWGTILLQGTVAAFIYGIGIWRIGFGQRIFLGASKK